MAFAAGVVTCGVFYAQPAYADHTPSHSDYQDAAANANKKCGGADTSIISCPPTTGTDTKSSGVWHLLMLALNILTAGVGIVAVGGIAYGAALYASSADKPDQAKAGMTYIKNVVIGLVAYGLMYVLLNFLIPGGIFSS